MGPWTQADLDKHAAEHGGLTNTKGPDASGLTTHYFGDGTYVTMLGDLPRMFGSGTLAEDEAAPPQQQRGMGMTQQELEAILGGFGIFFLRNFAQVMGDTGQIPVLLAAWSPPVVAIFSALGLLLHVEDG